MFGHTFSCMFLLSVQLSTLQIDTECMKYITFSIFLNVLLTCVNSEFWGLQWETEMSIVAVKEKTVIPEAFKLTGSVCISIHTRMSFSWLSLLWTKKKTMVRFLFTLQIWQEYQDLTTNPVGKNRSIMGQKINMGAGSNTVKDSSVMPSYSSWFVLHNLEQSLDHQRLWCKVNFMKRCLPICNIEDIVQEGYEGELRLRLTLAWQ